MDNYASKKSFTLQPSILEEKRKDGMICDRRSKVRRKQILNRARFNK